jgi:hypothetical protein
MTPLREPRFLYAGPYRSRELAEAALADLFAHGAISESERPQIIGYGLGLPRERKRTDWHITLPA